MKKCHQLVLLTLCLLCAFSMQMIHETAATAAEHVSDNLTVDGPVYLPETDSPRVFLSKRKEFAAESFFDAIGIGDIENWSSETQQREYGRRELLLEKNTRTSCVVEPGRVYYIRDDCLRIYENILEFYLKYGRIPNSGPIEYNRWNLSRNPVEHIVCQESLPFMSAEQAVNECINVLKKIGIDATPVLVDFHAFSGEMLAKNHAEKLKNDKMYMELLSLGAKNKPTALNNPKDIYCLLFGFTHHNIWTLGALEQVANMPNGDNYALSQTAVFYLASDGFMKIELVNITEPVSEGESVPIMTYRDALSKAADALANDPKHDHCVREVYLSYLPVDQKNGQIEFRPHWNFFLTYDLTNPVDAPIPWMRVLRVDALSGQVI